MKCQIPFCQLNDIGWPMKTPQPFSPKITSPKVRKQSNINAEKLKYPAFMISQPQPQTLKPWYWNNNNNRRLQYILRLSTQVMCSGKKAAMIKQQPNSNHNEHPITRRHWAQQRGDNGVEEKSWMCTHTQQVYRANQTVKKMTVGGGVKIMSVSVYVCQ